MKKLHTFVVLAYKESEFLEDCINSVLNQSVKTNVVIATTTENKYIKNIAKKYKIDLIVGEHTNIGGDFDFAKNSAKTPLVTIAHQDDIYDFKYAENIIKQYKKHKNSTIIFTDSYEIRNNKKVTLNTNLIIKKIMLFPLKFKFISNIKFVKRMTISFGNSICCPAVTFVNKKCPQKIFDSDFLSNVDWHAWEKLSKINGKFVYISKKLVGHRIDETTTTTSIIKQGIRTKEDLEMFKKFWPKKMAEIINKFYSNSEKSNK